MGMATRIDGKRVAAELKQQLTARVQALQAQGVKPGLGTILVGDDSGSRAYVAGKHRDCAEVGIASLRVELPAAASQGEVGEAVRARNDDPACTGFIVQLPLPPHLDMHRVLQLIDPGKDADGLHPENLGKLVLGMPGRCRARPAASSSCSTGGVGPMTRAMLLTNIVEIAERSLTWLKGGPCPPRTQARAAASAVASGTPSRASCAT